MCQDLGDEEEQPPSPLPLNQEQVYRDLGDEDNEEDDDPKEEEVPQVAQ